MSAAFHISLMLACSCFTLPQMKEFSISNANYLSRLHRFLRSPLCVLPLPLFRSHHRTRFRQPWWTSKPPHDCYTTYLFRTYVFFVREQLGTTVPWCNSRPFLFLSQLQQELRILLVYRLCEFWLFLTDIGMAKWGEGDPRWIVEERADAKNVNNWHW